MLELNFAATNTVAALVLNGVTQPAGLYDAATVPAYLAGTGSLQVVPSLPSSPTNLMFSVSGNTLSLSWPSNYVGWILQTNVINVGVSNDWYNVPGSETNTQLTCSTAGFFAVLGGMALPALAAYRHPVAPPEPHGSLMGTSP